MHTYMCNWVTKLYSRKKKWYWGNIKKIKKKKKNPTSIHEDVCLIIGLAQWVKGSGVAVSCGVGRRSSSDSMLLWPWCRWAATGPIWALAWQLSDATHVAIKRKKKMDRGWMWLHVWLYSLRYAFYVQVSISSWRTGGMSQVIISHEILILYEEAHSAVHGL